MMNTKYYTKLFTAASVEQIGEWINSFYNPNAETNSSQNTVEIETYLPLYQTTGTINTLHSILVTIKVTKRM